MSPDEIRRRFADHCGTPETFRKFVEVFNRLARRKGRLAFWQQRLWDSFVKIHPEFARQTFTELDSVFHLCHVHMVPLADREVRIERGQYDIVWAPEYERAMIDRFPYAIEFTIDSPAYEGKTHLTVKHCRECWAEMKRYLHTAPQEP